MRLSCHIAVDRTHTVKQYCCWSQALYLQSKRDTISCISGWETTPQVPGVLVVLVGRRRLLLPEVGRRGRALAIASHMSDNLLHVLIVQLRARHRVC